MSNNSESGNNTRIPSDPAEDQTKKFEIARYYTHGDEEKANEMVTGSYKDIFAIKVKFSSSSVYGAFIVFFNSVYMEVVSYYGVTSHSFLVDDIDIGKNWKDFEKEISNNIALAEHDDVLGRHVKDEISEGFSIQFGTDFKKLLDNNDDIGVNHMLQKLAQDRLGFSNIKVSVNYNQLSSLDMELDSISSRKLTDKELSGESEDDEDNMPNDTEGQEEVSDPLEGKTVKLILKGAVQLSPIKGTEISELVVGDKIMLSIVDKNPKAISLAKAFNAYVDNRILPIPGRIISIKHVINGGYRFFVIVAKGIFIKIDEEEENIKVTVVESSKPGEKDNLSKTQINIPIIILIIVLFLILIGFIVFII